LRKERKHKSLNSTCLKHLKIFLTLRNCIFGGQGEGIIRGKNCEAMKKRVVWIEKLPGDRRAMKKYREVC
jgi:ribosomal protein L19E